MVETIAQIFGVSMVGIIIICLVWTIISYIYKDIKLKKIKNEENNNQYRNTSNYVMWNEQID